MARKKTTTAASTETSEAASETQATEAAVETATSEAANATNEAVQTETQAVVETAASETTEAASYTVTWTKMAGRTIKGLKGTLITFDAEGTATCDAENARRLAKIRGVSVEGL